MPWPRRLLTCSTGWLTGTRELSKKKQIEKKSVKTRRNKKLTLCNKNRSVFKKSKWRAKQCRDLHFLLNNNNFNNNKKGALHIRYFSSRGHGAASSFFASSANNNRVTASTTTQKPVKKAKVIAKTYHEF